MLLEEYIRGKSRIVWALLRPQTYLLMCIYMFFSMTMGTVLSNISIQDFINENLVEIISSFFALGAWYISGTALNDYADFEIDQINLKKDPQRPLLQGTANKKDLLYVAIIFSVLSFLLAINSGKNEIVYIFVCLLLLNVAYSLPPIQISRRGGFAPLMLPLGYIGLTYWTGYLLVTDNITTTVLWVFFGLYLHFMSRIILKDYRDVKGDKKAGKITFLLKYGNKTTAYCSILLFAFGTSIIIFSLKQYIQYQTMLVIILSGTAAITVLHELSNSNGWPQQKPLITIFGRLCSLCITLLLASLLLYNANANKILGLGFIIGIVATFIFSLYSIYELQSTKN